MSSLLNNHELVQFIQNQLDKIMIKADDAPNGRLDIYCLSAHFALDNVTYMVFGESMYALEGNNLAVADSIRLTAVASCPSGELCFLTYSRYLTLRILILDPGVSTSSLLIKSAGWLADVETLEGFTRFSDITSHLWDC